MSDFLNSRPGPFHGFIVAFGLIIAASVVYGFGKVIVFWLQSAGVMS